MDELQPVWFDYGNASSSGLIPATCVCSSIWPTLINSQRRRGVQIKEWTWTPAAGDEPTGCSLRLKHSFSLQQHEELDWFVPIRSKSTENVKTVEFRSHTCSALTVSRLLLKGFWRWQVHVKYTNKSKSLLRFHFPSPKLSCHSDSACQQSSRLRRSTWQHVSFLPAVGKICFSSLCVRLFGNVSSLRRDCRHDDGGGKKEDEISKTVMFSSVCKFLNSLCWSGLTLWKKAEFSHQDTLWNKSWKWEKRLMIPGPPEVGGVEPSAVFLFSRKSSDPSCSALDGLLIFLVFHGSFASVCFWNALPRLLILFFFF